MNVTLQYVVSKINGCVLSQKRPKKNFIIFNKKILAPKVLDL